jgi:hypothetical protein
MRAASQPVSFSLRSVSSARFLRHVRPTGFAVICLLFTVALTLVPKVDISETSFDEANNPTNEIVVEKAASLWEHWQSVTPSVPRIFVQPRSTNVPRILAIYVGRLTDSRAVRELLCFLLC